ncbi:MAG: CRISPR-associated endonuclease Cas3'' [Pyrobaculum sp.]|jgi:CRISPR-associated endonuclease Cas3-HD|uniref:CRISPR-associated endonuclease Cas3'' n=1 Tax=Pyrobaculum sp. TaxID=2004705 RepID=UPI003CBE7C9D
MSELLAWCGHGLKEHLRGAALIALLDEEAIRGAAELVKKSFNQVLNERALRREVESTTRRLAEVAGLKDAKRAVALAAYLHDVGKAIEVYQRRLKEAGPRCKASLRGHEVWSAWVAYHVAKGIWGEKGASIIAASVALHHSARRSIDDVVLDALKVWPSMDDVDLMFRLAEEGLKLVGLDPDVASAEAAARHEWFRRAVLELTRSRLLVPEAVWGELIIHVIAIADNLDSALVRSDGRIAYVIRPLLVECHC